MHRRRSSTAPRPVVALLALLAFASGCAALGYPRPEDIEVRILDIDVGMPSAEMLPLKFRALITNYSSATMEVREVRYRLWVNEDELVGGTLKTLAPIEGDDQVEVELPLEVRYDAVSKGLKSLMRLSENRYRLVGVVVVDALIGTVELPFDSEGEISLGGG